MSRKTLKNRKMMTRMTTMTRKTMTRRHKNRSKMIRCCMRMIWRKARCTTLCRMKSCQTTLKVRNTLLKIRCRTLKEN